MKLIKTLPLHLELGEGIFWDDIDQAFWWTDIENNVIYRYHIDNDDLYQIQMPYRVASFARISNNNEQLLVAFDRGIALYHITDRTIIWLTQDSLLIEKERFNDGRVDPFGRFWVGTMSEEQGNPAISRLFCVDNKLLVHQVLDRLSISNGLCFTQSHLYHADSTTQQIKQYQYSDLSTQLLYDKIIAKTTSEQYPDGAITDKFGHIWSAIWGGACVSCFNQQGKIVQQLNLATPHISCCAFGGKNGDILAVTSAQQGLSLSQRKQDTNAGNVFFYQLTESHIRENVRFEMTL